MLNQDSAEETDQEEEEEKEPTEADIECVKNLKKYPRDSRGRGNWHKEGSSLMEAFKEKRAAEVAQATRIQYGGSVTPDSVDGLMAKSDIDGCLVGGASLFSDKFAMICNFKQV